MTVISDTGTRTLLDPNQPEERVVEHEGVPYVVHRSKRFMGTFIFVLFEPAEGHARTTAFPHLGGMEWGDFSVAPLPPELSAHPLGSEERGRKFMEWSERRRALAIAVINAAYPEANYPTDTRLKTTHYAPDAFDHKVVTPKPKRTRKKKEAP